MGVTMRFWLGLATMFFLGIVATVTGEGLDDIFQTVLAVAIEVGALYALMYAKVDRGERFVLALIGAVFFLVADVAMMVHKANADEAHAAFTTTGIGCFLVAFFAEER